MYLVETNEAIGRDIFLEISGSGRGGVFVMISVIESLGMPHTKCTYTCYCFLKSSP